MVKKPNPRFTISLVYTILGLFVTVALFFRPIKIPQSGKPYGIEETRRFYEIDKARDIYAKHGCPDVYLESTVRNAEKVRLPIWLVAAEVVVESNCNPNAVSEKDAIGLMQITPIWRVPRKELLDPEININAGTAILAAYVHKYGLKSGIKHYNGSGEQAEQYARKVLKIGGLR